MYQDFTSNLLTPDVTGTDIAILHKQMTRTQIINEAKRIEPGQGALISLSELRARVGDALTWLTFDEAILDMASEGSVWLHRHVGSATEQEEALNDGAMADDSGRVYVGMVIR